MNASSEHIQTLLGEHQFLVLFEHTMVKSGDIGGLVKRRERPPPHAHWLSWSGGGEQGQTRHRGPVFKVEAKGVSDPPKLAGQGRARTRRLLVSCNVLTWHTMSMVRTQENTTNDEVPVNELTSFEK